MNLKIDESLPHYSKSLKEVKKICKTIEEDIKKEFSTDIDTILQKASPLAGFGRKLLENKNKMFFSLLWKI
ncbi:MAG: hypothetical protein ABIM13_06725 [candidate division WOR-3 bacterium]